MEIKGLFPATKRVETGRIQENPTALKIEAQKDRHDNGKRCNYCIDTKGWKEIGHTEINISLRNKKKRE
jgi:hypothetical protein